VCTQACERTHDTHMACVCMCARVCGAGHSRCACSGGGRRRAHASTRRCSTRCRPAAVPHTSSPGAPASASAPSAPAAARTRPRSRGARRRAAAAAAPSDGRLWRSQTSAAPRRTGQGPAAGALSVRDHTHAHGTCRAPVAVVGVARMPRTATRAAQLPLPCARPAARACCCLGAHTHLHSCRPCLASGCHHTGRPGGCAHAPCPRRRQRAAARRPRARGATTAKSAEVCSQGHAAPPTTVPRQGRYGRWVTCHHCIFALWHTICVLALTLGPSKSARPRLTACH
jgi:hypothetical protein